MVGWFYIAAMVLVLPALAARSAHALNSGKVPLPKRSAVHINTIVTLAVLMGVSLTVARIEAVHLFPRWSPTWIDAAAVAVFLILTLGALSARIRRLDRAMRTRLERVSMDDWRDPGQLAPYALVCIMAGIAEEVAYRGVLAELLTRATGSHALAIVVACIAFGAAHAVQGWRSAALASIFAALFHGMVMLTGHLYAAMIAHATYDFLAGLVIAEASRRRRARRIRAASAARPEPPAAP
ncbi:MAG: CPBP family intramembrane metalloprotease [Phycisphaeraceae bacterium]|nr:CPBP family intramembrane metalloprotease [Phycisphaeraceae bacterium]